MQKQEPRSNAKTESKEKKGKVIPGLPYPSEIIALAKEANLSTHERHILHCLRASMHRNTNMLEATGYARERNGNVKINSGEGH